MPKPRKPYRRRATRTVAAAAALLCAGLSAPLPSHAQVAEVAAVAGTVLSLVSRFLPSAASPADLAVFQNRRLLADLHDRFDGFEQALARTENQIKLLPEIWRTDLENTLRERDHGDLRASFGEIDDYMIVASQGRKPLVSPDIEQKYNKLRVNARNLMGKRFDIWNLPILLMAFNYEYRLHHAFEIPQESALTEEMDTAAKELKELFREQQYYIETANEEGKLTADTDSNGNFRVRYPLSAEHEDEVATRLQDYTARRKQLESRFAIAFRELQAHRKTVQDELKTIGDRYSDYFNKAPGYLYDLVSEARDKEEKLSSQLTKFRRSVLRKFSEPDDVDIKFVTDLRYHYSSDFLPKACGRAKFDQGIAFCPPSGCQAQRFIYWETLDWAEISANLEEYRKRAGGVLAEVDSNKGRLDGEIKAQEFNLKYLYAKFKTLNDIYGEIPPDIVNGRSFDFNQASVGRSVTTEERTAFEAMVESAKNNLEQQRKIKKHINIDYRRLADSINKFRSSIPGSDDGREYDGKVRHWMLATACCKLNPLMGPCFKYDY